MFAKFAVAMNQGDLALLKAALENSGAHFYFSDEYHATCGGHPDFFPVYVAEKDREAASAALKESCLEKLMVES
jgi:hypothetical protein